MNAFLLLTIVALASPIFGDESTELKKQDKRGIVNLGYGGHYPGVIGAHGLTGYSGYGGLAGFGHGYVPSPSIYHSLPHGFGHGLNNGVHAAPSIAHAYTAPISPIVPYSHGYNHHAPSVLAAAPWRVPYNGFHGAGYGHGVGYINGW